MVPEQVMVPESEQALVQALVPVRERVRERVLVPASSYQSALLQTH